MQLDHMRGMSPETVAWHVIRAMEKGYNETCLTLKGKLMVLVSRFFPWIADIVVRRTVRKLFKEEIEARKQKTSHPEKVNA